VDPGRVWRKVIVSHENRYLFIEVPHTASTAISRELRQLYGGEPVLAKHSNYSEFLHSAVKPDGDYFVFAAVRNPLDQVVTEYSKMRNDHGGAFTNDAARENRGGWVSSLHMKKFNFVAGNPSFTDYLKTFYRSIYQNSVLMGHDRFDFIMRFENIGNDFGKALALIGIEPVRPLPAANRTRRQASFVEFYDAEAQRHAARVFGPFMEKWGYSFPAEWGPVEVPAASRMRFAVQEAAMNHAARWVCLSPRNPSIQRLRSVLKGERLN
jgi:hypothetical protein